MNIYTQEDAKILTLKAYYRNLSPFPESTMKDNVDEADLTEVYKINPKAYARGSVWLLDILDDKNISYKIITKDTLVKKIRSFNVEKVRLSRKAGLSKQKHIITHHVFVFPEHEKTVLKLIKQYNNPTKIEALNFDEYTDTFDTNNMPQTKCPSCGEECDSDYTNCPYCKNKLY
ncbi:MAG: zinc ribbon domain-containing protein [Oscillospiraceae bacterium]|nr:zinc ribbon domain-containing protein [Oscillospiraceae bacterium]